MHQAAVRIRLGGEYAGEYQFLNAVKVKMRQTDNGTGDAGHERSAGRKHGLYKSRKREYDRDRGARCGRAEGADGRGCCIPVYGNGAGSIYAAVAGNQVGL